MQSARAMQPLPYIVKPMSVSSGMLPRIHSALSWAMPSRGSSVALNAWTTSRGTSRPAGHQAPVVVTGSMTRPSMSAGSTPASSMARRNAVRLRPPTLFSGVPSQRRAVGECPMPTAATLPRCSQRPRPSSVRNRTSGLFGAFMARPPRPATRARAGRWRWPRRRPPPGRRPAPRRRACRVGGNTSGCPGPHRA